MKKKQLYENALKDLNIRPLIKEAIRKIREEKDFDYSDEQEKAYLNDIDSIPDNNADDDLERIMGKLGISYNDIAE
jgi:hypothetical protein